MDLTMFRLAPLAAGLLVLACGNGNADAGRAEVGDGRSPGARIFNAHCALCHGRDGRLGLNGARDLTLSTLSREEMIATVRQGKGAMMPYKDVLTEKEIDAVVEHVRSLGTRK
jgi:mono/diheme cytochrome c family protein